MMFRLEGNEGPRIGGASKIRVRIPLETINFSLLSSVSDWYECSLIFQMYFIIHFQGILIIWNNALVTSLYKIDQFQWN